jgi:hypothetical protein
MMKSNVAHDTATSAQSARFPRRERFGVAEEFLVVDEDSGAELAASEIASSTCVVQDGERDAEKLCGAMTADGDRHGRFLTGFKVIVRK